MVMTPPRKPFKPAPEGLHSAVCVDVVDRGMQQTQWGMKHKIQVRWQIAAVDPENGRRFLVMANYTNTMDKKAALRKMMEAWRGKKFTEEQVQQGIELDVMVGRGCQLQVVHNDVDGTVYANVQAVVPLANGTEALEPEEYIRVQDRPEYVAPAEAEQSDAVPF